MEAHLPYKSVVVFIACGTMLFAIVFVFAKRQITRFALKSNRVPHAAIGANVPKALQREIEARLRRVETIKYEAQLLSENITNLPDCEKYQFYFRMKAVDAIKPFEEEVRSMYPDVKRVPGQSLHRFLLDQQLHEHNCLHGIKLDVIDRFVQLYEHARHEPPPFQQEQYQEYMDLLNHLLNHIRNKYERDQMRRVLDDEDHEKQPGDEKHGLLHVLIPKCNTQMASACLTATALSHQTNVDKTGTYQDPSSGGSSKETCVVYRPNKMKESDSGMFLLTSRHSSSSDGSSGSNGTRFRQSGADVGSESYV